MTAPTTEPLPQPHLMSGAASEPTPDQIIDKAVHKTEVDSLKTQLRDANDRLAEFRIAAQQIASKSTGVDLRQDIANVLNEAEGVSIATKIGVLHHHASVLAARWEGALMQANQQARAKAAAEAEAEKKVEEQDEGEAEGGEG